MPTSSNQLIELAAACDCVSSILLGKNADLVFMAELSDCETFSEEELSAQQFDAFQINVFPYSNLYLSSQLVAGGDIADATADFFSSWNYRPDSLEFTNDHFGIQFAGMKHFLLSLAINEQKGAEEKSHLANEFISSLLLPAVLPFSGALACRGDSFSKNFSQVIVNLAVLLQTEFAKQSKRAGLYAPMLENATIPGDDASLTDIIRFMLTPNDCGIWLSKGQIRQIASDLSIPCGFSHREDMLTNLFHTAGTYNQTADLILELTRTFTQQQQYLVDWRSICEESIIRPMQERLERSLNFLDALHQKATSGDLLQ